MPAPFFTSTVAFKNQYTSLFDFLQPTAAALRNLRWQVRGYLDTIPNAHVRYFKHYVEHQDGYKLINKGAGEPFSNEKEVQLYFGLVWFGTRFDINRETNQGRGPVDYKVSRGDWDKSLIEFKLASNRQLKRNLEK